MKNDIATTGSAHILYGIQASSQGSLDRAKLIAAELAAQGIQADFLLNNENNTNLIARDDFLQNNDILNAPLAEVVEKNGKLQPSHDSSTLRFVRDLGALRVEKYDLVLTDNEPVSDWASKLKGVKSIGIGHQNALYGNSPRPAGGWAARGMSGRFKAEKNQLGLHWHPYDPWTLPPVVNTSQKRIHLGQPYTLVYLPHERLSALNGWLEQLPKEHFVLYSPAVVQEHQLRNISFYRPSHSGFRHHLERASRVICDGNFDIVSDALVLGIPVLTKPFLHNFEQHANSMALADLGYAETTRMLNVLTLEKFITHSSPTSGTHYPNVAKAIARFCSHGNTSTIPELASSLWKEVRMDDEELVAA